MRWSWGVAATALVMLAVTSCQTAPSRPQAPSPLPVPVPAVTPTPTPTPSPAPTPTPMPPAAERDDLRPPLVRVLVSTAPAPGPAFPEPGRRFLCSSPTGAVTMRGPLELRGGAARQAFQVGAFARQENARALAERLEGAGLACEVVGSERLIRVVVLGQVGESDAALLARLRAAGVGKAIRSESAAPGIVVVRGEGGSELSGDEVRIVPLDPEPVLVGGKHLRGDFLARPGAGGPRVINVLNLEAYLRGVVPAEMGPRAFPAAEALKAQAVAARTYAVAHLGDHEADGYDLCDTTACQVYGGADAEQAMSDAAVRDTAGEIATYRGKPIDAMYHSTCAGHTEDGGAVFPARAAPYLKGVPCRGEGRVSLGGGESAGGWVDGTARLALVGQAAARQLGVAAQPALLATRLGGQPSGAGAAGLAAAFGLDADGELLHVNPPTLTDVQVLTLLSTFRLPIAEPPAKSGRTRWELALVVRLAQLAGAVHAVVGRVVAGPDGARLVADPAPPAEAIPATATILERRGEQWRLATMSAPTGSPTTAWFLGGRCLVVEVEPLDAADARSPWNWWVRELPLAEIARRVGVKSVERITVTRRGVSGRALEVRLETDRGATARPAYPFRLALELPDTLFTVSIRRTAQGAVARFVGRGWGHGVGMCQNGAYGLALGGSSYREILADYYTGITVERWSGEVQGGTR